MVTVQGSPGLSADEYDAEALTEMAGLAAGATGARAPPQIRHPTASCFASPGRGPAPTCMTLSSCHEVLAMKASDQAELASSAAMLSRHGNDTGLAACHSSTLIGMGHTLTRLLRSSYGTGDPYVTASGELSPPYALRPPLPPRTSNPQLQRPQLQPASSGSQACTGPTKTLSARSA